CESYPHSCSSPLCLFHFHTTSTTEIYTLSYTTLFRSRRGRPELPEGHRADRRRASRGRSDRRAHPGLRGTLFQQRDQRGSVPRRDRKSTRLNSSHLGISYAVFCLKKKKNPRTAATTSESNYTPQIAHLRTAAECSLRYTPRDRNLVSLISILVDLPVLLTDIALYD